MTQPSAPRAVVNRRDLNNKKGIRWGNPLLNRMIQQNGFPAAHKITLKDRWTWVWYEDEVDAWMAAWQVRHGAGSATGQKAAAAARR